MVRVNKLLFVLFAILLAMIAIIIYKNYKKKYYSLYKGSKEVAVFTGRQPRQAALKAARRGHTNIRLRERGRRNKDKTYTIYKFKGRRKQIPVLAGRRGQLPTKIWKARVKKIGVEKIKKL